MWVGLKQQYLVRLKFIIILKFQRLFIVNPLELSIKQLEIKLRTNQ
jgi:hypothetical protein